jgi:cation-transporting ATPase G
MRQNLLLSGGILLTLIPLAATGVLGLAAVVAVHELAEVVVIANGVRAGRHGAFRDHAPLDHDEQRRDRRTPAREAAKAPPLPAAVGGGDDCHDDCCRD